MVDQVSRKRFNALEWVGILAGLAALVFSFFPWRRISGQFAERVTQIGFRPNYTAWSAGLTAWLAVIALLLAAALLLARAAGVKVPGSSVLWLLLAVTSVVLIIIRWVTLPELDPTQLSLLNLTPNDLDSQAGNGLFLCLGVAVVSVAAAVARVRTSGRRPSPSPAAPDTDRSEAP